jgi:hypothetical protein
MAPAFGDDAGDTLGATRREGAARCAHLREGLRASARAKDARRVARGARPRGAIDAKYPLGASPEEASLEEFLEPRASAFFFARRFFPRRDNDRRLTSSSLFSLRAKRHDRTTTLRTSASGTP